MGRVNHRLEFHDKEEEMKTTFKEPEDLKLPIREKISHQAQRLSALYSLLEEMLTSTSFETDCDSLRTVIENMEDRLAGISELEDEFNRAVDRENRGTPSDGKTGSLLRAV